MTDLARIGKKNTKTNRRLLVFLINLPGIWLTLHIFKAAYKNINDLSSSRDLWKPEISSILIEEFKYYRNIFYSGYILVMIFFGLLILGRGIIKFFGKRSQSSDQDEKYKIMIPALLQGIILVTFSYALAGLLLDIWFVIKRII